MLLSWEVWASKRSFPTSKLLEEPRSLVVVPTAALLLTLFDSCAIKTNRPGSLGPAPLLFERSGCLQYAWWPSQRQLIVVDIWRIVRVQLARILWWLIVAQQSIQKLFCRKLQCRRTLRDGFPWTSAVVLNVKRHGGRLSCQSLMRSFLKNECVCVGLR